MDDEARESADLTEIRIENLLKENAASDAKLARCVEALEGLLNAWDRAEGGRGCYSCAELHDCRCEFDRKISTVCTCGRVELDAAAETARAALVAAKGGE